MHKRTAAVVALPDFIGKYEDVTSEIVVARLDAVCAVHTFAPDVGLALDPAPLDVAVTRTPDGYEVTVTARSFARDVTLLPDRLAADATVDEALVTLVAGESAVFRVRTSTPGLERPLSRAPVLRTANDLRR